ncbi:unnamed protein product [Didymodactylos carnosus]|uniref:Ankyrin repeat protein n=1 Tax=Didymodactylos carnosus TaxID=1234261 RepID=A0A813S1J2_9BILA|nr:unnamed protein product [Didymodactylos carnosus]CAF1611334.1 unnamed protein product [Didymodactylos carnosus]CAF3574079.1 unnamed protein product [Didymodactylos carnosus]CAF4424887.1 unnamed protein product [Didymodactylos carnosus]
MLLLETDKISRELFNAIDENDVYKVKTILLSSKVLQHNFDYYEKDEQPILHYCCLKGNLELVKLFVQMGANQYVPNRFGWLPLHVAIYLEFKDITQYLLNLSND